MERSPATFDKLPIEIKVMILKSLSDVQSLLACIASSPDMLHCYRRLRDAIYTTVVTNMIGEDLLRQATFLTHSTETCLSLQDYQNGSYELSVSVIKVLFREERLTRSIIQRCVDDELEQQVKLSEIEWLRLRRGLYNFRVMARLSQTEDDTYWEEFQDIRPFCQSCTSYEILEMLYILYCLRNRFGKHLCAQEDDMVHALKYEAFHPHFDYDHSIFCEDRKDALFRWNSDGPWQCHIDTLDEQSRFPACWTPEWPQIPEWEAEVDQISTLSAFIPIDHDFDDAEGVGGIQWLNRYNKLADSRYDYHYAIPLGFMIWDDKRLEGMEWSGNPPPLEPIPEKWRERYQNYESVEERFMCAFYDRRNTGEKLNTHYDHLRDQRT